MLLSDLTAYLSSHTATPYLLAGFLVRLTGPDTNLAFGLASNLDGVSVLFGGSEQRLLPIDRLLEKPRQYTYLTMSWPLCWY